MQFERLELGFTHCGSSRGTWLINVRTMLTSSVWVHRRWLLYSRPEVAPVVASCYSLCSNSFHPVSGVCSTVDVDCTFASVYNSIACCLCNTRTLHFVSPQCTRHIPRPKRVGALLSAEGEQLPSDREKIVVFCFDHAVADASYVLLQVACCDSQLREVKWLLC